MNIVTQVQILDETVCISHSANALVKGMYLTILFLAIKRRGDWAFNLGIATSLGERKL